MVSPKFSAIKENIFAQFFFFKSLVKLLVQEHIQNMMFIFKVFIDKEILVL